MTKAKKTILSIIGFAIFLIIALLIQKTIILKSLSIDNVGVAENQITVEYNGETEIYNLPR
jgi:hypothetical protein|nr:MAG TPA: hypothetical protein [Bacteriophage sp.]